MLLALIHEAWVSIEGSRLRTFLAMLGIVIGVGSVVLMMAIGDGSKRMVEESIDSLGSDLLVISPGNKTQKGLRKAKKIIFSEKIAESIAHLPLVVAAAPATSDHKFTAAVGKLNSDTQVAGVTPDYFVVRNRTFTEGNSFTVEDLRGTKNEAVLGPVVAGKLFPDEVEQGKNIVGSSILINAVPFHVAGILAAKGPSYDGRDQDDLIFVPLTTAKSRLFGQNTDGAIRNIFVKVISKDALDDATDDIISLLRQRQNMTEAVSDNFIVRNLVSIMKVATETTQALSLLLGATAAISLVVGGIGIMNIMLVTVTERTREIGIRKALGANERHIMTQFLMEAVIIASLGSMIGLAIGIGGGLVAQEWFSLRVEFNELSVLLALAVAVGVGIASGLYPAYKAAKLEPIEALRIQGA